MSAGGLSRARLGRLHGAMAGYVERGEMPGLVTLISRRGEMHVDAMSTTALGGRDPMRRDTIFRIASLTKPVAAAAAMILVEECKLRLDEPVDRLLPQPGVPGDRRLRQLTQEEHTCATWMATCCRCRRRTCRPIAACR